jgi:DNA-binding MarR family transcriptional regulator
MENIPSKAVVGAWIRLMRAQQATLLKIERAFREAGLPPHAWYDVLWELDQVGDKGLRPFEIERQMLIAQSNISRLIDKLEAAGYVERCPCEQDGRGQMVVITAAGRATRKRMWPVYAKAISTVIGARISDREATSLSALLDQLLDRKA